MQEVMNYGLCMKNSLMGSRLCMVINKHNTQISTLRIQNGG